EGLLELLAVRPDHVEDEGVVHRAREALGGAALHQLGLEHADHVGGADVAILDGVLEAVVGRLFERPRAMIRGRFGLPSRLPRGPGHGGYGPGAAGPADPTTGAAAPRGPHRRRSRRGAPPRTPPGCPPPSSPRRRPG